jgi:hypothetical protein
MDMAIKVGEFIVRQQPDDVLPGLEDFNII